MAYSGIQSNVIVWMINTIAIMLAIHLIPGISYDGAWWGVLVVGVIFGLVNTFIRPLVSVLSLPFLLVSLGLFTFVINAFMLRLTAWLSSQLNLGFSVEGFGSAFWGALVISMVSMVLGCIQPYSQERES